MGPPALCVGSFRKPNVIFERGSPWLLGLQDPTFWLISWRRPSLQEDKVHPLSHVAKWEVLKTKRKLYWSTAVPQAESLGSKIQTKSSAVSLRSHLCCSLSRLSLPAFHCLLLVFRSLLLQDFLFTLSFSASLAAEVTGSFFRC